MTVLTCSLMSKVLLLVATLAVSGCTQDKVLHAAAGAGVGVVGDEVLNGRGCELAIAVGLTKELIDPVFSTLDLLATSIYCLTLIEE